MLFNVPGATSSPGFPATVTRPGFVACLNCRCEPRCRTTDHPSFSSIFTTSRIFTTRSTLRSVYGLAALARPSTPFSHDVRRRANTESLHMPTIVRRSPGTRPQKRPQQFSDAVNCSENSTSNATPSLPWAQGVAGSNPVAPTTFHRPGFHRGSNASAAPARPGAHPSQTSIVRCCGSRLVQRCPSGATNPFRPGESVGAPCGRSWGIRKAACPDEWRRSDNSASRLYSTCGRQRF
jgi:hypothetical protein